MDSIGNIKLKIVLIGGISIIFLALMANIAIFKLHQLNEPVFFEHYLEIPIYDNSDSTLFIYYVTNKNDDKKVINIEFPELETNHFDLSVTSYYNDNYHQLKYYNIYRIPITLTAFRLDVNDDIAFDDIILDDAVITFNNGDTMEFNLGETRLYNTNKYKRSEALDFDFVSTSSDSTSTNRVKTLEPVSIKSISSAFKDKTKDILNLEVQLSEQAIPLEDISYPLNLDKDSKITFSSEFKIEEEDIRKFNYYDIVEMVHLKNQKGIDEYYYIRNIRYEPYFDDKTIKDFLKSKGAIK